MSMPYANLRSLHFLWVYWFEYLYNDVVCRTTCELVQLHVQPDTSLWLPHIFLLLLCNVSLCEKILNTGFKQDIPTYVEIPDSAVSSCNGFFIIISFQFLLNDYYSLFIDVIYSTNFVHFIARAGILGLGAGKIDAGVLL